MAVEHDVDNRFIAAGCLILDYPLSFPPPAQWHHLCNGDESSGFHNHENHSLSSRWGLDEDMQAALLASDVLNPFAALFAAGWIHLAVGLGTDEPHLSRAVVRVYLLPDDLDNASIPRSHKGLRKARVELIKQLDYSNGTWHGTLGATRSNFPGLFDQTEGAAIQDQTLIKMFNRTPQPLPDPGLIDEFYAREAAIKILDDTVPGVTTKLYPYQRRSAALMLQRETTPGLIADPRYVKVVDQNGQAWYLDPVAGVGVREPRHYEGPRGGILAEQMGSGKTLICLALIEATKHLASRIPELHIKTLVRPKIASLADMAAACATSNSVPWRSVLQDVEAGMEYPNCVEIIRRNPGRYMLSRPSQRRSRAVEQSPVAVYLSHTSLVIVPANLIWQWSGEINKHTKGLRFLIIDAGKPIPSVDELLDFDLILFSNTRFERLMSEAVTTDGSGAQVLNSPLARIQFKRVIVDEGHRLGSSTQASKSDLHLIINLLQVSSRWIVTGTPSKGLIGVDDTTETVSRADYGVLEREDLKRIGSITSLYLHIQPWANEDVWKGDRLTNWMAYVLPPKPNKPDESHPGRVHCLRETLAAVVVRHPLSEIKKLLPTVEEKIVYLDGSYQDVLALNIFAMMIIFNTVQSERTDRDYFFHPYNRKALGELVSNLRQASFFGGAFFSPADIARATETAEQFLAESKVPVTEEDRALLLEALEFGRIALRNNIKECAYTFKELPLYVEHFPFSAGKEWSLDHRDNDPVLMDSSLVLALQQYLQPYVDSPRFLKKLFNSGDFTERGIEARSDALGAHTSIGVATAPNPTRPALAGQAQLGSQDAISPKKRRSMGNGTHLRAQTHETPLPPNNKNIAPALKQTQLVSTASAKLSYLLDQVLKHSTEDIIIFYENESQAYYIAGALEILQVKYLIYSKGISAEQKARNVTQFTEHHNNDYHVLLMDLSQAAFGLDVRTASRIYFVTPVLNPQVQAQAIGRAVRLSHAKPTTVVETLVLRGSLEELLVQRREQMSRPEQWKCRSVLDDRPMYEWILKARILPLPKGVEGGPGEMSNVGLQMLLLGDEEEYDEEADGDYVDKEEEEVEEERDPDGPSPRKKARVTFVLPGEEED
ncbi:P-loop containing nucleoside triphosphate hydrolase protein [Schizothecium vesticola]|uniref:P-loop containing nucleoside triphosphate hydrolase protein n=1 Tax=Schizothecium vesticola TaxID=314040 RepID=A0AA40F9P7_9PEZI|nr:P-loop containing nucleoside triphosphate hydrolase protein [Schizothecium vesticola]